MSFENNHYEIVRNAVSEELCEYISICCDIFEQANLYYNPPSDLNPYPFGDLQTKTSFGWYASLHGESMLKFIRPKIESVVKKPIIESYSYFRIYYENSILEKHLDRASCEYSATLCLKKNENWPIFIEDINNNIISIELDIGDMLVYKGNLLKHWREKFLGKRHHQLFLHYVDSFGSFAETNKYDGRPLLGLSGHDRTKLIQ